MFSLTAQMLDLFLSLEYAQKYFVEKNISNPISSVTTTNRKSRMTSDIRLTSSKLNSTQASNQVSNAGLPPVTVSKGVKSDYYDAAVSAKRKMTEGNIDSISQNNSENSITNSDIGKFVCNLDILIIVSTVVAVTVCEDSTKREPDSTKRQQDSAKEKKNGDKRQRESAQPHEVSTKRSAHIIEKSSNLPIITNNNTPVLKKSSVVVQPITSAKTARFDKGITPL